jgi:hypothetical protein
MIMSKNMKVFAAVGVMALIAFVTIGRPASAITADVAKKPAGAAAGRAVRDRVEHRLDIGRRARDDCARASGARQRPRPDAEIVGGEVS